GCVAGAPGGRIQPVPGGGRVPPSARRCRPHRGRSGRRVLTDLHIVLSDVRLVSLVAPVHSSLQGRFPYAEVDRQCPAPCCRGVHPGTARGPAAPGVPARRSLAPYGGGGLNIAHASASAGTISTSATKAGLNLLGGTTFKLKGSHLTPFAEARGELGGGKTFILTGGVRF